MINSNLHDWWTDKKLTELTLKDNILSGAGISVKVFIESLNRDDLTFLSEVDVVDDNNLYVLVLNKFQLKSLDLIPYEKPGPIERQYGELFRNSEFKIPNEIKSLYRTDAASNLEDYFWSIDKGFEHLFSIHDNCFFSNYSAENINYKSFIKSILQVHSYYHNKEIDWKDDVISFIMQLLKKHETIKLESSKTNVTTISYKIPNKNFFTKIFRNNIKISKEIIIKNGTSNILSNILSSS